MRSERKIGRRRAKRSRPVRVWKVLRGGVIGRKGAIWVPGVCAD